MLNLRKVLIAKFYKKIKFLRSVFHIIFTYLLRERSREVDGRVIGETDFFIYVNIYIYYYGILLLWYIIMVYYGIMVTTGRAHCIHNCILCSLFIQFEHSLDWVESLVRGVHYWHICFAHCSQFEHSCDSTMQSNNV